MRRRHPTSDSKYCLFIVTSNRLAKIRAHKLKRYIGRRIGSLGLVSVFCAALLAALYTMPLPPLVSGSLPAATPGPYKYIGYSFIRAAPLVPWTLQSPKLSDGQPAISVQEVAYSVFYPCQKPASSWLGSWSAGQISWVPEPHGEVARGYERFLSGKGSSRWGWLCRSLAPRLQ